MNTYSVQLCGTIGATVEVEAATIDEAEEEALRLAGSGEVDYDLDWELDGSECVRTGAVGEAEINAFAQRIIQERVSALFQWEVTDDLYGEGLGNEDIRRIYEAIQNCKVIAEFPKKEGE